MIATSFLLGLWTLIVCFPNDPAPSLPCWIVFIISALLFIGAMLGAQ